MTDEEKARPLRLRRRVALIETGEFTADGKPILRERVRIVRVDGPAKDKARGEPGGPTKDKASGELDGPAKDKASGGLAGPTKDKASGELGGPAKDKAHGGVAGPAKDKAHGRVDRPTKDKAHGAVRCEACGGSGGPHWLCPSCVGYGWVWDDGVPATPCSSDPAEGAIPLPCGRRGSFCPGCGRPTSEIPVESDLERGVRVRIGEVLMAGPEAWEKLAGAFPELGTIEVEALVRKALGR